MVGLGGGFVMVPALRLLYGLSPAVAAGTSLILVVANSASGSFAYLRQRRVDVRLGLLIAAGGFPGSILGAMAVARVSGFVFDVLLGTLLIALACDIIINNQKRMHGRDEAIHLESARSMPIWRALLTGLCVGFVSSLFGIGGGVIVVPVLLYFSSLPAHAISATSHFAIVLTSPIGLLAHIQQRDINLPFAIPLVLGGIAGGQVGAKLSLRLKSPLLIKLVAAALIIAAIFLVLRHFIK
ncbi:MAG: sulfite exporter TauE/SafE family protein [Candidatus Eremiobacteraeota bacterium]|nr:sulfite exporter TauE/SafE family protein [Candidatus Eremiobacteraeota bacterium]